MTKMKQSYDSSAIEWLDVVDSTNSEVRRRMGSLDNLSVIAARFQTAGRGQGDHVWVSPEKENLTFSVLLKFGKNGGPASLPVGDAIFITYIATTAIHSFLSSEGIEARIKWPNDVWVGDKKICGMLIENILEGKSVKASIVGIGINVNQSVFDPALPNPVSLSQLTGRHYPIDATLGRIYKEICHQAHQLDSADGRYELESEFNKYLFRIPE